MIEKISIEGIKDISIKAGAAIMEVYGTDFEVDVKSDDSPLTEADRRSNTVIVAGLSELYPNIPILSEEMEAADYSTRRDWDYFWLIDPLDGTKEFVKKNGEFTVNIALVSGGVPVLGVVYQPVGENLFWAKQGEGAWKSVADATSVKLEGGPHYSTLTEVTVVASRSHLSDDVRKFVAGLKEEGKKVEFLSAGSSLKLCLVAEGSADVYPRLGPTMEWDTGAAHAVAAEANRRVTNYETGEPLRYNKENLLNPFFIVQ